MSRCPHPTVIPHAVVWTLEDPSGPGGFRHSLHIKVFCGTCNATFRFPKQMPLAPDHIGEAIMDGRGAWVSASLDELGVLVTPDEEAGAALDHMIIAGRA